MLITQAEWARRHGFSRQYVSKLVARGVVRLTAGADMGRDRIEVSLWAWGGDNRDRRRLGRMTVEE